MDTVAAEVAAQPSRLTRLRVRGLPKAPQGSIFVGAGDSYAAANAVFHLTSGRFSALDPYVLAAAPQMAARKDVFFISISGRTSSNVIAARRVKNVARRTTAITSNQNSPLAKTTDAAIILPYKPAPRTPGTLSFTLSLLTSLKASVGELDCNFNRAFEAARRDAKMISFGRKVTYFLGNGPAYSAALYGAAKVYEIFGGVAHAELLEEFGHLELFSLRKDDAVNILSCFDPDGKGPRLQRNLREHGFNASLIPARGRSEVETLFHSIFLMQLAMVERARLRGITKPAFLLSEDRLQVSDSMIY